MNGFELTQTAATRPSADLLVLGIDPDSGGLLLQITNVSGTVYLGGSTDGENFFQVSGGVIPEDVTAPYFASFAQPELLQLFNSPLPP